MMNRSPVQRTCFFTAHSFGVAVAGIFAIVMIAGCSEQDDNIPVVPNGVDYDTTMMALIPAGKFRMGNSTDHPDGDANEKPVHEVTITRPFLMARKEVTQALYEAVMGSNPSYFKGPNLPVEQVTW
jgi:formylglycine-generating enzyme required for sulfatase activity